MRHKFLNFFHNLFIFAWVLVAAGTSAFPSNEEIPSYKVFRGICHVHTNFSHDSNATLSLILEKAQEMALDFVVITDHNTMEGLKAYQKMKPPAHPLFIFGDEISTKEGHLIALGIREHLPKDKNPQELIDLIHAQGGYAFLAHPFSIKEPWKDFNLRDWDGFELYDFGHELMAQQDVIDFALRSISEDTKSLLSTAQKIPEKNLDFWDSLSQERKIAVIAGTDAHLERYEKYFSMALKSVSLYVLAKELNEKDIVEGIGSGRSFIAFDNQGMASDFSFWAESDGKQVMMGESLTQASAVSFHVRLPLPASVRLIRNGEIIKEETTQDFVFDSEIPGVYRVEVYRDGKPWIYSNGIVIPAEARENNFQIEP